MKRSVILSILALSLLWLGAGCAPTNIPAFNGHAIVKDKEAVTLKNSASALDFKITEFQWFSVPELGTVKVVGNVVSESSESHQAVRAVITVYDQDNNVLGQGTAFLVPAFVGAGKKAKFEFYFLLPKNKKPENLRLEAVFRTLD